MKKLTRRTFAVVGIAGAQEVLVGCGGGAGTLVAAAPAPPLGPASSLSLGDQGIRSVPTGLENLPSWIPAAGQVSVLSQSSGKLTNSFVSRCAPYFDPFYSAKICNDYSGSFLNPHFGSHGAILFFGGGHAGTNDNSLMALVLGPDACSFRRMIDPTPIFGSDASAATRNANSTKISTAFATLLYAEYTVDGKPVAPHSYGSGDVIGPNEGGAAYGTFIRVVTDAGGVGGSIGGEVAHKVDLGSLSGDAEGGSATPYRWQRIGNNPGALGAAAASRISGPQWSAFVPAQNRIDYETRSATAQIPPRWFDRATSSYVYGTGKPRANDSDGPDNGTMFHVPSRNLLIFMDRQSGTVRIAYMDVSAAQPNWVGGSAALSQPLAVSTGWACACWCADNDRIIVGGVSDDSAAVYEIEIPAVLLSTWAVSRAPFGQGQTIQFADSCTYKKWSYNPKVRAIVYMPLADANGANDTVFVYRPRNT